MSKLFDILEDESEPSQAEEIGRAMGPVIEKIVEQNNRLAEHNAMQSGLMVARLQEQSARQTEKIVTAVSDILKERPMEVASNPVRKWVFTVERDNEGFCKKIIATPE